MKDVPLKSELFYSSYDVIVSVKLKAFFETPVWNTTEPESSARLSF